MGMYAAGFAVALVVLQTSILLLHRDATQWSFHAVQRKTEWPDSEAAWQGAPAWMHPGRASVEVSGQLVAECLANAKAAGEERPPSVCWRRVHQGQRLSAVLSAWNPHLVLLALCCVHAVLCVTPHGEDEHSHRQGPQAQVPVACTLILAALIVLVVGIVCAAGNGDQMRYPTILLCIGLLLGAAWYAFALRAHKSGGSIHAWTLVCHMQLVSVPLAVVMAGAMGVRFWQDLLMHAIGLSVAVNLLWLQANLATEAGRQCARLLTIAVPTYCCAALQRQWTLSQNAVVTAWVGILPFYLLTIFRGTESAGSGGGSWERTDAKLAHICIAAGLLGSVASLATL